MKDKPYILISPDIDVLYEDRSDTIAETKIDEKTDDLIDQLRRVASKDIAPVSFKDRIEV